MTQRGLLYPREGLHIPKGEASYTNIGTSYIYRGAFSAYKRDLMYLLRDPYTYRGASNSHRGPTIPAGASCARGAS